MTEDSVPATLDGFEVRLHRSGRTIAIPAGETILEMLLDAGVDVAFSCSEGVCGTCETKVIDGIPDHRDSFLSEEEKAGNSKIMICCSRSKSPVLTLDL
jgi:tetrachlorobenzoquinone reductase